MESAVYALAVDSQGRLYMGGRFNQIFFKGGTLYANNIAYYDNGWFALGTGVNGDVRELATDDTTLYVGGAFTEIGGVQRNYIAAIDKATGKVTDWNPQLNNEVRSISIVDNKIVVNGPFTRVNDSDAVNYTAVIDPATGAVASIQPLNAQGTPLPGTTTTLTIKIDELIYCSKNIFE